MGYRALTQVWVGILELRNGVSSPCLILSCGKFCRKADLALDRSRPMAPFFSQQAFAEFHLVRLGFIVIS